MSQRSNTTTLVLDTNIIAALLRSPSAAEHLERSYALAQRRCVVPSVVRGEILALSARRCWDAAPAIASILHRFDVVGIESDAVVDSYVVIDQRNAALRVNMGKNDVWIAAVTRSLNATLLTTDADYGHLSPAAISVERVLQQQMFSALSS